MAALDSGPRGLRVVTFRDDSGARVGVVRDGQIVDLVEAARAAGQPADQPVLNDMLVLISAGGEARARVERLATTAPAEAFRAVDDVELLAPIPRPRKNIFCVGRNYAAHAAESLRAIGQEVKLPEYPNFFTKAVTAVNGPYADILYDPRVSTKMDWEVELGVVIGRGGRHIAHADALAHVWGYTIINDVSARDIQNLPGVQWFQGKSLDGSCPMGPQIVTADAVVDPHDLHLRLTINGVTKQDDTTAHLLFDLPTLIATLSRVVTLEPGDIIATGTPEGVGFARNPPEFLHPGDIMESTIDGIGTMRNRIVAAGE